MLEQLACIIYQWAVVELLTSWVSDYLNKLIAPIDVGEAPVLAHDMNPERYF